jgi:signal transduction histidine kinase
LPGRWANCWITPSSSRPPADTGIGIPPHRIEEIFEPFHQLDSSSTRKYGGTGIGLSLVRQIVEAHGSMLEVVSADGKGSTFKFPLLTVVEEHAEK